MTDAWNTLMPIRGALTELDPDLDESWEARLRLDQTRLVRHQTERLAAITETVTARSQEAGAVALVLTGSTARGHRTKVSDLDYHVIGARPSIGGISEDIDLYDDEPSEFRSKLQAGDDFVHWSAWFGCVIFDHTSLLREAATYVARTNAWPDAERKREQSATTLDFSRDLILSEDYESALEQTRGALSLTARWLLLCRERFPLARDELSGQLVGIEERTLAEQLRASIHDRPDLDSLLQAVESAQARVKKRVQLPA